MAAVNRPRRANAGSRMAQLLNQQELEQIEGGVDYAALWGGFHDVENDRNFEPTAADEQSADEDENSELDAQNSDDEVLAREDADETASSFDHDDEPKRKKQKIAKPNWLLSLMSETMIEPNTLTKAEQEARLKECKAVATVNREWLEDIKQKQLNDNKKQKTRKGRRELSEGPREKWFSDRHITYMVLPEFKRWLKPKIPACASLRF